MKSSICGIQHTCINFFYFPYNYKKECWPVFKQDPCFFFIQACREGVSGVLLCFSLTDQTGWQELPRLLANSAQATERATVIPLATRFPPF